MENDRKKPILEFMIGVEGLSRMRAETQVSELMADYKNSYIDEKYEIVWIPGSKTEIKVVDPLVIDVSEMKQINLDLIKMRLDLKLVESFRHLEKNNIDKSEWLDYLKDNLIIE